MSGFLGNDGFLEQDTPGGFGSISVASTVQIGSVFLSENAGMIQSSGGLSVNNEGLGFRSSGGNMQITAGGGLFLNCPSTNLLALMTQDKARATFLGGRVQTTDATVTTVTSRTLADNIAESYIAYVAGKRTGSAEAVGYMIFCTVYRAGAGAVLIGQTALSTQETAGAAANACVVDVNSNDLRVRATGQAGQTWEWHATLVLINSNA